MANVILNLPMPVLNGPGAAVDVSTQGRDKTVVITGDFAGATITLEVSEEAGGAGAYAPVYTFQTGDQQKTFQLAARYLRVNVANRKATVPFSATADVAADDMGATFAVLTLPANNGPGASTNVSAQGEWKTIVVGGSFPGATILIEASDDGTSWAPVTTFAGYGGQVSQALIAEFLRVNVAGRKATVPFTASIAVGAIVDPTVPPVPVPSPGASTCYIYQPGGGQTGPGTFDTWADLMTSLAAARVDANGGGCYTIQFDDSFTSPAVIPAGAYDMTDVTWEGTLRVTAVSIADGASFTKLRMFAGPLAITNNNTVTPANTDLANGELVVVRQTSLSTVGGGQPFFRATGVGAGQTARVFLYNTSDLGGSAVGTTFSFPTAGSTLAIALDNASTIAARASLVGGATSTLSLQTASLETLPTVFTNWAGTVSTPTVTVGPSLVPKPYLVAAAIAPFASAFGQWLRFNASGGAIAETLPAISTATGTVSGPGCFVAVTESGGGTLTVGPVGGDTIQGAAAAVVVPPNGALLLVSDGVSDWRILGSFSSAGVSAGESNCLIYQPGGTGTGPGTFSSWATLMTRLAALRLAANGSGCYTIQFDDSITSPAVIPAGGPYNMTNVTWEGDTSGFGATVSIANGASFTKLRTFMGALTITNLNTVTAACADLVLGDIVDIHGATLDTVGGGASFFTAAGAGNFVVVQMFESAQIGAAAAGPVFTVPGAGSTLFIVKEGVSAIVSPAALVGGATATLSIATASLQSLETVFPGWAGTVSAPRLDVPPSFVPQPYLGAASTVSSVSSAFGQWRRKNATAGTIQQQLPAISTAVNSFGGPGCLILVSDVGGAGTLNANAAAGDTIQGGPPGGGINVPSGGALLLISDGVSNWTVVAQYGNKRYQPAETWNQNDVAASQTNVALSALVSVNFDTWKAPRAGSIVAIVTRLTEARTAGTLTVKATINGVATTLSVITNAANTLGGISTEQAGIDKYVAGDLIGMQVTTDAGWLPITSDLEAYIEVEEVP